MLPDNSSEDIKVRMLIEMAKAVDDLKKFRELVDQTKAKLIQMASGSKQSLDTLAESLMKSFRTETVDQLEAKLINLKSTLNELSEKMRTGLDLQGKPLKDDPSFDAGKLGEAFTKANSEVERYSNALVVAKQNAELLNRATHQAVSELTLKAPDSAKGLNDIKQFSFLVDQAKQKIVQLAQQSGQSFGVVAKSLKESFRAENIDVLKSQITDLKNRIREVQEQIRSGKTSSGELLNKSQIDALKSSLSSMKSDLGGYKTALSSANEEARKFGQVVDQAYKTLNQETKNSKTETNGFASSISNLGNIAKSVFMGIFGVSVVSILRNVIGLLQQSTKSAYEFGKALFQLEVGIRALRRSGMDITTQDMLENLDRLKERFGVFSRKELVEGASAFANLNRDMGFTKEELFSLQEAIATLAVVNGRSMDEVQKTVALALSSGYTEGLQRLGVSINRVTIAMRAAEMGWTGGYTALTEQQRAAATLSLVLEKTGKFSNDLTEYQKTLAGGIDKTTAAIKDQQVAVGRYALPAQRAWNELLLGFYNILQLVAMAFAPFLAAVDAWTKASAEIDFTKIFSLKERNIIDSAIRASEIFVSTFVSSLLSLFKGKDVIVDVSIKERRISIRESFENDVPVAEQERMYEELGGIIEEYLTDAEELEKEVADRKKDAVEDYYKDLEKITRDGERRRAELERDYKRDLEKIALDHARKALKIETDYQNKIADLQRKYQQDIADASTKLNFDIGAVWREYYAKIAEEAEKYRLKELEREREYQEELLKLREDYLVDLEDALQARDARAVMKAIKKYNLDKERARRENELQKLSAAEAYQFQLAEEKRRRDERLRRLQEEYQMRLAALKLQLQRELEEAARKREQEKLDLEQELAEDREERKRKYDEQLEDLRLALEEQRLERLIRYQDQLADIQAYEDEKIKAIAEGIAKETELTQYGAEQVTQILENYFGKTGIARKIMQEYANFVKKLNMPQVFPTQVFPGGFGGGSSSNSTPFGGGSSSSSSNSTPVPVKPKDKAKIPGFAEGGAMVARQPTQAIFAEKTPEVAIFSPLNQIGDMLNMFGGIGTKSGDQKMRLEVLLSPDLEGRIVDQTLDEVADVVLKHGRSVGGVL